MLCITLLLHTGFFCGSEEAKILSEGSSYLSVSCQITEVTYLFFPSWEFFLVTFVSLGNNYFILATVDGFFL